MSNEGKIAIKINDGYKTVIISNSTYDHVYPLLCTYYDTAEKIENLMKFGDIIHLGKKLCPSEQGWGGLYSVAWTEKDVCVFWDRDYHQENFEKLLTRAKVVAKSKEELLASIWPYDIIYIFENGQWEAHRR